MQQALKRTFATMPTRGTIPPLLHCAFGCTCLQGLLSGGARTDHWRYNAGTALRHPLGKSQHNVALHFEEQVPLMGPPPTFMTTRFRHGSVIDNTFSRLRRERNTDPDFVNLQWVCSHLWKHASLPSTPLRFGATACGRNLPRWPVWAMNSVNS